MNFIGVDLAWKVEPKSRTALVAVDESCSPVATDYVYTDEEILEFVKRHCSNGCIVGIDAPLIVRNRHGRRECERLLQKYGVPSYPANREWLTRAFGGIRGEILVKKLRKAGVELKARPQPKKFTRAAMEIYPYSALKFLLKKIPRYKKGDKNERTKGISELRKALQKIRPPLITGEIASEKGLKKTADLLDAAIAAYTVFLYWKHGEERCEVIGSEREGFILIPKSL
ncbi:MAG: DUF429 domain-containing protein [Candidatus Hydrothermarchaeota archaeon]|nr:DUF429 domain-containing protein [Candidatus Hydrothermarchaeota archaeon]